MGKSPDLALRHAEHLGHIGKCAARLKRREAADHGTMLATVFREDDVHDVIFAVVGKINVNVRQLVQRHPLLVEEAPEVETEADRTNIGNSEAITNERIRRTAARDPFNALLPAILQNVPDDQEIFLVADGRDDAQLLLDLRAH